MGTSTRPLVVGLGTLVGREVAVMKQKPGSPVIGTSPQQPYGFSAYVGRGPNSVPPTSNGRCNAKTNPARPQRIANVAAKQPPNLAWLSLVVMDQGIPDGAHSL